MNHVDHGLEVAGCELELAQNQFLSVSVVMHPDAADGPHRHPVMLSGHDVDALERSSLCVYKPAIGLGIDGSWISQRHPDFNRKQLITSHRSTRPSIISYISNS